MTPSPAPERPPRGLRHRLRTALAWFRRLSTYWMLAIIVVIVGFAAAAAFTGYTAYDYTTNNPAFCRSCHIMEAAWDRWSTSEHRNIDCHSCHKQSVVESARQVVVFAFRRPEQVGKHAEVPAARCANCHESGNRVWRQVAETAGHQVHAERKKIECVVCHSTSVHRFKPAVEVCASCHQAQAKGDRAIKIAQMADFHCVDCHQYLRPESPLRPTRLTCLQCHQGLPTTRTVGWPEGAPMSSFTCATCHKPHEKAQPVVTCTSCHPAPKPAIHPKDLVTAGATSYATCTTCHVPHRWTLR